MALSLGIVGLPNVGKSTLFNALTKAQNAESANYPFCTIEPNKATVPVPDERVEKLAQIAQPERCIYATVDFTDIAGLVHGASNGEGLGNQFLAHIRECSAIIHVVRCFASDTIIHVDTTVDPIRDIKTINLELLLADMQTIAKRIERVQKLEKSDKTLAKEKEALHHVLSALDNGTSMHTILQEQPCLQEYLAPLSLICLKPVLYCMNVDEQSLSQGNEYTRAVEAYATKHNAPSLCVCAVLEEALQGFDEEEHRVLEQEYNIQLNGLEAVIQKGYAMLGLSSYFTVGKKEVRAWTIPTLCKAPEAAGVIHTDFQKGFIRAEVIHYDDFIQYGSTAACRNAGVLHLEGKEYCVQDGDIIHFLFNV